MIQKALEQLEKYDKQGFAPTGEIEYMKVIALFAIAERLDRIEAAMRGWNPLPRG